MHAMNQTRVELSVSDADDNDLELKQIQMTWLTFESFADSGEQYRKNCCESLGPINLGSGRSAMASLLLSAI